MNLGRGKKTIFLERRRLMSHVDRGSSLSKRSGKDLEAFASLRPMSILRLLSLYRFKGYRFGAQKETTNRPSALLAHFHA